VKKKAMPGELAVPDRRSGVLDIAKIQEELNIIIDPQDAQVTTLSLQSEIRVIR